MKLPLSCLPWVSLLLCTALGPLACGSLKTDPERPPPDEEEPPAVQFRVSVAAEGPEYCRQGTWTLSISVEGGTPERVALERDGREVETLAPPYRHTVDCATHAEGRFAFVARAMVGDRSFASPSASVVVDRTSPRLDAWRPALPFPTVDAPVELVFSEPLLPESLQAAPTRVRDGNGFSVAHQAVLVEDGKVLRLVPAAVLRPPVTLNVELVQRNMTDRAGNPLDVTQGAGVSERRFSYWPFARVGERMSELPIEWYSMALELRSQARPVVAFVEGGDTEAELVVARWSGEAWERLAPPREAEARSRAPILPRLEVARQGGLVLAWLERVNSTERIHVSRYDGTSWTRQGAPHDTQSSITDFQMALDPQGYPVLVYQERDVDLRVVRWTGTAWEFLGDPLSGNPQVGSFARYPAIAVDSTRVVVAWSETPPEETYAQVFVMEFRDGAWSRVGRLLRGTEQGRAERVAVALDGGGVPVVAWIESYADFADGFIFAARWRSTATFADWMPPEQLQGATPYAGLRALWLVRDAAGEPWVAWPRTQAGFDVASVFRRRRAAGWEPEQLIAGSPLSGFRLDDKGFPWVSAGYPWEVSILRPQ